MILITGGAGFIGSNLAAALNERGETDVIVCDRLGTDAKWRNLAKRELADVIAPEALPDFLTSSVGRAVRAVFHMGAISATTATDADLVVETNFRLSMRIWRHCAETGATLVYASSAATYGDGAQGFLDRDDPASLAKLAPLNLYGWSKHLFDRAAIRLAEKKQAPPHWCGCKFFNVFGPNEYHKGEMQSVVAKITPEAIAGRPARLFRSHRPDYPDGGQLRDFVWVDDVCDAMLWMAEAKPANGLYNIGSGAARSWLDLVSAIYRSLGVEPKIDFIDMPEALKQNYQYYTQADIGKLRGAGYSGQATPLETAVQTYVADYLTLTDRYR
ncbi:MAG: ADP-glyceromanno-heptose 6-epimerase [Elsteraceae bacterium]